MVSLIKEDLKSSFQDRWLPAIRQESSCKLGWIWFILVGNWRGNSLYSEIIAVIQKASLFYEWADHSEGTRQSWQAGTADFQGNSVPRHHHPILVCWTMGWGRGVGNATFGIQRAFCGTYTDCFLFFFSGGYFIEVSRSSIGNNEPFLAHNLCPLHTKDEFHQQNFACYSCIPGVILLIHNPQKYLF